MPTPPIPPPPLKYEPLQRSSRRWVGAVVVILIVLALVFLAGRAATEHVRDLTAAELRAKMAGSEMELDAAIAQVNRMDALARREVLQSDEARQFIQRLPPEQRLKFVEQTLDRGIQQQIERYRKLDKDQRKEFIEDAKQQQKENRQRLDDLPPDEKERVRQMASSEDIQEMVEKALKAFLSLTTSAERAELAPLYEGALENLNHAQSVK